jgi:hypothetical protein
VAVVWTDPSWLASARAWIDSELDRLRLTVTGELEQPHVMPWSTVLRVPTSEGPLWFKANMDVLAHEARLVSVLSRRWPDLVTELVAADPASGWMLMRDGGVRMRDLGDGDLSRWDSILPLYAQLQIEAAEIRDELLALAVPDRRLAVLPALYEELLDDPVARGDGLPEALTADELRRLRERLPAVRALSDRLAALGVPETIQHDDLHDGNVFVRDGRYVFFDWGDACVTHPFLTMTVTLHGVLAWLLDPDGEGAGADVSRYRDVYLEPFTTFAPRQELVAASPAAVDLGVICRALSWHLVVNALEPAERGEWASAPAQRLRWFLEA